MPKMLSTPHLGLFQCKCKWSFNNIQGRLSYFDGEKNAIIIIVRFVVTIKLEWAVESVKLPLSHRLTLCTAAYTFKDNGHRLKVPIKMLMSAV